MVLTNPHPRAASGGLMPPVALIATGLVIVYAALRLDGFDLLLDPVGWAMCAVGLSRLRDASLHPADPAGAAATTSMVFLSIVDLLIIGPAAPDTSLEQALDLAEKAGSLLAIWLIGEIVAGRLRPGGHASRAALLDVLRWTVAALGVAGMLAPYGYAGLPLAVTVAWFAALVVLVVVLYRSANLSCLDQP